MEGIHDFALFVVSGLLLNLTPGADTLYIVGRSAREGALAGAMAALGIGAGCCVHIAAAAVGLSALLAASATAFTLLKLVGAAYLVYLGVSMLRSGPRLEVPPGASARSPLPIVFLQGALTNVLNPKVALFFLAFLPQFVTPDAPARVSAFLLLGIVFNVNGTLWNLCVASMASRFARVLRGRAARGFGIGVGALFVALGVKLALEPAARS